MATELERSVDLFAGERPREADHFVDRWIVDEPLEFGQTRFSASESVLQSDVDVVDHRDIGVELDHVDSIA